MYKPDCIIHKSIDKSIMFRLFKEDNVTETYLELLLFESVNKERAFICFNNFSFKQSLTSLCLLKSSDLPYD